MWPVNSEIDSGVGEFLESSGVIVVFRYLKLVYAMQHPVVRGCQWPWGIRLGSYYIRIVNQLSDIALVTVTNVGAKRRGPIEFESCSTFFFFFFFFLEWVK